MRILIEGIMRNISVIFFLIWASGTGDVISFDTSLMWKDNLILLYKSYLFLS